MFFMKKMRLTALLLCSLMLLFAAAFAESGADTRWADASDEIDKYLDAAFESYLDGDYDRANYYIRIAYDLSGSTEDQSFMDMLAEKNIVM